jgi:hypothetical protein
MEGSCGVGGRPLPRRAVRGRRLMVRFEHVI